MQTATTEPRKRSAASKTALPNNSQAKLVSRSVLAIGLFLLAVLLARDFLSAIGWAVIIAVTTWPIYLRFKRIFGSRRESALPALIFALAAGAVILVPIALAAHQAAQESSAIEQSLQHYRRNGIPPPAWVPQIPAVGEPATRWWQANLSDPAKVGDWIGAPADKDTVAMTPGLGVEIMHRLFLILISLIALYSFLRHGSWVANRCLEAADRLLGLPGERLASKMVDAIRGTVNGTVTVAVVEGVLIGVAYVVAGVPNPLLFTLLTIAFALLPLGAWAVFGWASIVLIHGGDAWAGAGLFLFGAAIMLIGDTFFWPALVGEAARLPFLVAFIGIFGGLKVFGLLGLFLGPVIMAALYVVWREWLAAPDATRTKPP